MPNQHGNLSDHLKLTDNILEQEQKLMITLSWEGGLEMS